MNSSVTEIGDPIAQSVVLYDDALAVLLTDGRTISVPLLVTKRARHNAQPHTATFLGPAPTDGDLPRGPRG
jgi:hypothetical protein